MALALSHWRVFWELEALLEGGMFPQREEASGGRALQASMALWKWAALPTNIRIYAPTLCGQSALSQCRDGSMSLTNYRLSPPRPRQRWKKTASVPGGEAAWTGGGWGSGCDNQGEASVPEAESKQPMQRDEAWLKMLPRGHGRQTGPAKRCFAGEGAAGQGRW